MADARGPYVVHGMTQSFFTRKMTGYLDYKGIPWRLRRFAAADPEIVAAGWPGGIPAMQTPEGEYMWDTTAVIHHLEHRFPDNPVLPPDPVTRFLCYVLEDVCDEWLYRVAVGSRWFCDENTRIGRWELARELTVAVPVTGEQAEQMVESHMRSSCPRLGVTEENVEAWIDEVLRPWLRRVGEHLESQPYLFGERPSLADFALFGGSAAHLINDPLCRRWTEEEGRALVGHTHRLLEPQGQHFGEWSDPKKLPETLVALLADPGRLYLPWVSRATVQGEAEIVFASGQRISVEATDFLVEARGILLARYAELRCDALDAVLERAGILRYFSDFTAQADTIPDCGAPPRPLLNRPFPPARV